MKNLIKKIEEQPFPIKMLGVTILCWVYPIIEAIIFGATGYYDLSIVANILLFVGLVGFAYLGLITFFIPIGKAIIKIFKK